MHCHQLIATCWKHSWHELHNNQFHRGISALLTGVRSCQLAMQTCAHAFCVHEACCSYIGVAGAEGMTAAFPTDGSAVIPALVNTPVATLAILFPLASPCAKDETNSEHLPST